MDAASYTDSGREEEMGCLAVKRRLNFDCLGSQAEKKSGNTASVEAAEQRAPFSLLEGGTRVAEHMATHHVLYSFLFSCLPPAVASTTTSKLSHVMIFRFNYSNKHN